MLRRVYDSKAKKAKSILCLCFVLLIATLFLASCTNSESSDTDDAKAPTYTGMTVTKQAPIVSQEASVNSRFSLSTTRLLAKKNKPLKEGLDKYFGIEAGQSPYYANPGEDVYITVTFDNPNDYEILSFTLNGEKYSSYMFEHGSDMENIVLKVNVGDAKGLISYTIDAIKYVDKDKIKDVKIGADRTVKIGIYNENQPTASLSKFSADSTSAGGELTVNDPEGLISAVSGKLYAVIYDGENVVAIQEITAGKTELSFEGLIKDTEYTFAAVAVFDAYDGGGRAPHVLYSEAFITSRAIRATNIKVDGSNVSFDLSSSSEEIKLTSIMLIDAFGEVVFESFTPVDRIENIPGGKLTLKVSFNYEDSGTVMSETSETVFWCAEGMLPVIGEVSFQYSNGLITHPITGHYTMHQASELTAITDDIGVYSISDGVVVSVTHFYFEEIPNEPSFQIDGFIEILDESGVYHLYRYVKDMPYKVGDRVKLGDKLGVLYSCGDVLTSGYNLHYACYTLNGEVKIYQCPAFDTPAKSEIERFEEMIEANTILKDGLTVNGNYGETVTMRLTFNTVDGNEIVAPDRASLPSYATLVRIDDNVWDLTCDFSEIRESQTFCIEFTIFFDYFRNGSGFYLTFSPTGVPPLE